jgi:hypothetical protein
MVRINCDADAAGSFSGSSHKVSVRVAQTIWRDGTEQMWDFVLVLADRIDGVLTTRILLCHPEWAEPLEVASVQSSPAGTNLRIAESAPVPGNHL